MIQDCNHSYCISTEGPAPLIFSGKSFIKELLELRKLVLLWIQKGKLYFDPWYEENGTEEDKEEASLLRVSALNDKEFLETFSDYFIFDHCPHCGEELNYEILTYDKEKVDSLHIDDFIRYGKDKEEEGEKYARWVLHHFRLPALMQFSFEDLLSLELYCTYEGERYRVTGASRFGDVFLNKDPNQSSGYTDRVNVALCKNWDATYDES